MNNAPVAQGLEHYTYNVGVGGSKPPRRTNMNKIFKIDKEIAGQRLDVFLTKNLDTTRSQIQKMIRSNQIQINSENPKKLGHRLKDKDEIEVLEKILPTKKIKEEIKEEESKNTPDIKIITEEKDYLIIDKPTGLLSHSTLKMESKAVSEILLKKYPEIRQVGEDPARPGIVHRLDKDASGLMVVARNNDMFEHLKKQFKLREVDKEYEVLVHGQVEAESGEINFRLKRSKSGRMSALPLGKYSGKEALTEYKIKKRFINFTLLKVKIHTGRMHQIRAHMLAFNHPVVGDKIYFQKNKKNLEWDELIHRLFLHCTSLGFKNLAGEKIKYEIDTPNELEVFLEKIK